MGRGNNSLKFREYAVKCFFGCKKDGVPLTFDDANTLRKHHGRVHNVWDESGTVTRRRKVTRCSRCGKGFDDKQEAAKHEADPDSCDSAKKWRWKETPVPGSTDFIDTFAYKHQWNEMSPHLKVSIGKDGTRDFSDSDRWVRTASYPGSGPQPAPSTTSQTCGQHKVGPCYAGATMAAPDFGYGVPSADHGMYYFGGGGVSSPSRPPQYPQYLAGDAQQSTHLGQMGMTQFAGILQSSSSPNQQYGLDPVIDPFVPTGQVMGDSGLLAAQQNLQGHFSFPGDGTQIYSGSLASLPEMGQMYYSHGQQSAWSSSSAAGTCAQSQAYGSYGSFPSTSSIAATSSGVLNYRPNSWLEAPDLPSSQGRAGDPSTAPSTTITDAPEMQYTAEDTLTGLHLGNVMLQDGWLGLEMTDENMDVWGAATDF